jgi:hypothetical protein
VVAALDAERQELSRTEYLRRMLAQAAIGTAQSVTVEHLARFEHAFKDLADPHVMEQAWR